MKYNECCEVLKKDSVLTKEHIWEWANKWSQLPHAYNREYRIILNLKKSKTKVHKFSVLGWNSQETKFLWNRWNLQASSIICHLIREL